MEVFESLVPVGIVLLCLAGIVALIALAYFLITTVKSLRTTMAKVDPLLDECKVVLGQAQEMLDQTKPALDRIDPMLERLTLTIDAVNLEIMRVDQIMEDVNTITGNISKATESIDTVTSLPLDALSSVTSKIRQRITPLTKKDDSPVGTVASAVDGKLNCVEDAVAGAQVRADLKRAERDEAVSQRNAAQDHSNQMSSSLKSAFSSHIERDTDN